MRTTGREASTLGSRCRIQDLHPCCTRKHNMQNKSGRQQAQIRSRPLHLVLTMASRARSLLSEFNCFRLLKLIITFDFQVAIAMESTLASKVLAKKESEA